MKYKGIKIHKNKNCDTWYTRIRKNGKQIYISAKTQKECYDKLKIEYTTNSETIKKEPLTLLQWYKKWLDMYKIGKVKDTTIKSYNTAFNKIPKEIQNKDLANITLENLINIFNTCTAERLAQNLYDLLSMLYKKALDNEIITKDLIRKIDKPKHTKIHSQALTNDEQNEIVNICQKIPKTEFLLISMYQGLRRGEVLGLTRDNIDFDNKTLTINKAWNYKNEFDTTKNKQSIRTMPIFETSINILKKYKSLQPNERIFNLSMKEHDNIIKKVKEKSALDIKTKDMRATFITRCTELEIPEMVIQSWVGHKIGSKVTKDSYTTHNQEIDNKYINILNNTKFYSNSTQQE